MRPADIQPTVAAPVVSRGLLSALLLSIALHGVLDAWLPDPGTLHWRHQKVPTASFRYEARPPKPAAVNAASMSASVPPRDPAASSGTAASSQAPTHEPAGARSAVAPKFDLTPELLREIVREQSAVGDTHSQVLSSGAVVVDPLFAARLNEAARRPRRVALEESPGTAMFSGGSWSDFVRIDGMCFRVVRADPLTPLSSDTWYRERCPG